MAKLTKAMVDQFRCPDTKGQASLRVTLREIAEQYVAARPLRPAKQADILRHVDRGGPACLNS